MSWAKTFISGIANLIVFIGFNIIMLFFGPVWAAQGLTWLILWLIIAWVVIQIAVFFLTWTMIKAGESAGGRRQS